MLVCFGILNSVGYLSFLWYGSCLCVWRCWFNYVDVGNWCLLLGCNSVWVLVVGLVFGF